ncbi:hypothetical protein [Actinomadura rudentiformis]|nr:hypothetical protein [Actinomadura rudentiformis]
MAGIGSCTTINFRKSYSTGNLKPNKVYVKVCTSARKRWSCSRPG